MIFNKYNNIVNLEKNFKYNYINLERNLNQNPYAYRHNLCML